MSEADQQLHDAILDAIDRLIVVLDHEGRIVRFNRALEQAGARRREAAIGRPFWEVMAVGGEAEVMRQAFAGIIAGRLPIQYESSWMARDGSRRMMTWNVTPLQDSAGNIRNLICVARDASEPPSPPGSNGSAVRDQAHLLRLILDNMGDGVAVADRDGQFLLFNRAAERIVGVRPTRMEKSEWSKYFGFFLPDQQTPYPTDQLPLQRAIQGEALDDAEIFVRHPCRPGGSWISVTARPVRDETGNLAGGVTVVRDLTERKHAEEMLRQSEQRFRLLVEQAPISVQILTPEGVTLQVNGAFRRLFGVGVEELADYRILADPQLVGNGVMPYLRRAFAGESVDIPPVRYIPDRGLFKDQPRWMHARAFAVMNEDGSVRQVVLMHEDITSQRHAEDQLRQSEQHYREAAEHNRRLVREVEHRVGNNLAGLLGLVTVMEQKATDISAFAAAVTSRLTAMAHVHRMLGDAGWRPLGLPHLVRSVLNVLEPIARAEAQVTIDGPDTEIGPQHALPLAMILVEWFTNSSKYGAHSVPGGKLNVRWEIRQEAGGQHICLRWTETGGPRIKGLMVPSLGTELVRGFVTRELGGRCELTYPPEGANHRIEFFRRCPNTAL